MMEKYGANVCPVCKIELKSLDGSSMGYCPECGLIKPLKGVDKDDGMVEEEGDSGEGSE